jgi:hypothetical protein
MALNDCIVILWPMYKNKITVHKYKLTFTTYRHIGACIISESKIISTVYYIFEQFTKRIFAAAIPIKFSLFSGVEKIEININIYV